MSEMIERVAKAIHGCEAWSSFWDMSEARILARAAIKEIADVLVEHGVQHRVPTLFAGEFLHDAINRVTHPKG